METSHEMVVIVYGDLDGPLEGLKTVQYRRSDVPKGTEKKRIFDRAEWFEAMKAVSPDSEDAENAED